MNLTRYAWLSIAAALVTMALKAWAWKLTGSMGLLSDALESVVNLVAALLALAMLTVAAQPPDDDHHFGHEKAEYFSSGAEGMLILVAAAGMAVPAVGRLLAPQPLEAVGLGASLSFVASLLNGGVALVLIRAGRQHRSVTLEADGQHLLTDVWTSAAVLVGLLLVSLTGWLWMDPLAALLMATHVAWTGLGLLRRAVLGLLDTTLPAAELERLEALLAGHRQEGQIDFHALRTRVAGRNCFVNLHVLVPGEWTVTRGHDFCERLEREIAELLPGVRALTHLEPVEDPVSFADIELDR